MVGPMVAMVVGGGAKVLMSHADDNLIDCAAHFGFLCEGYG